MDVVEKRAPGIDLSVVVLAYNEQENLEDVVQRVMDVGEGAEWTYEVVIVDDCSTDRTPQLADELVALHPTVRCVHHAENMGSGGAIKSGVDAAWGERIIYVPADGQFDVRELLRFMKAAELADIVIGARLERSDYTAFRMLSSRTFLWMVRILFGTTFRDVNWVHLWHRKVFEDCRPKSEGVFLLEEIIVRATRNKFSFVEIESKYRPRQGGKATGDNPLVILRTVKDMLATRWELWGG